mmetsp:Transcript_47604/g.114278  ORF Transcript_47604/g.114278 Transcript_47604/m.114278 type:complete len:306 (+) Transcript_47604:1197-2114(+)
MERGVKDGSSSSRGGGGVDAVRGGSSRALGGERGVLGSLALASLGSRGGALSLGGSLGVCGVLLSHRLGLSLGLLLGGGLLLLAGAALLLLALAVAGGVGGGERVESAGQGLVHLALERGVPVILDGVVGAPDERLGNLRPPVAELVVRDDELAVLLARPLLALDLGVEVVVPSLAALLSDAAGKLLRDFGPLLRAELADELDDLVVLLLGPRPLDELGVEDLLPAVEALDVRALLEILGDLLPVLALVLRHGAAEDVVLIGGPATLGGPARGAADAPLHGRQQRSLLGHLGHGDGNARRYPDAR